MDKFFEIRKIIREVLNESLHSSSDKGQKIFKALQTGLWPSYESKGFNHKLDEKGRLRIIKKLSHADKVTYKKWLKTPEGKKSLKNFKKPGGSLVNETTDFVAGNPVKVGRLVYHSSSPQNRESILKNGLVPSVGDCYREFVQEKCVPAIFATDSENENYWFDSTWDDDFWEINTKLANVPWFVDKNFSYGEEADLDAPHVLTFEKIPASALKLIYKGTGEDK